MLATALEKYNVNVSGLLKSEDNTKLLGTLLRFSELLNHYGFKVSAYSQSSLNKLNEISPEKKNQIQAYFENWCSWIDPEKNPGSTPAEVEKNCLKKALDHYGLEASDDFLKTIDENQIIELYGEDMVQLYRSLSFFKVTGYSLLDISVYEWYVLWHRSAKAIEETMKDLQQAMKNHISLKQFEIPKQLIREVCDVSQNNEPFVERLVLAEFLHFGSLASKNSFDLKVPKGFICSSRAEVISLGETSNLQFI